MKNIEIVRRYMKALERGITVEELHEFFDPEVVQDEYPNRLVPNGARRDLAALEASAERGRNVSQAQRFEICNEVEAGDTVALEVLWSATLAVPVGSLAAGNTMRAHFAVFIEFKDGRIIAQRNYDCFDPW